MNFLETYSKIVLYIVFYQILAYNQRHINNDISQKVLFNIFHHKEGKTKKLGGIVMLPVYEIQPSDLKVIHNARELYFHAHLHQHVEIVYVFSGGQHMNIDGQEYEIFPGEAAVIFPDTVHNYYRTETRPTDEVIVICSPNLFMGMFPDMTDTKPTSPIITNLSEITKLAFKEISMSSSLSENIGWSLVIMSHLMHQIKLEQNQHIPVENLTKKIIQYISDNFQQDITLDNIADEFSVSKFYVSHIFSRKMKMNFRSYLAHLRTGHAANLIRTTDDTITNISSHSGFGSQRTFNRAFKEIYNLTPREYKNTYNKPKDR